MKLPNRENAYIPSLKLSDYLLSKIHPVGRWKSRFFRGLGFNETNVDMLEKTLISIVNSGDVKDAVTSEHGTKYIIDGLLQSPIGGQAKIRTVWIVGTTENPPRFVTAYPL